MTKTRTSTGFNENPTASDSRVASRRILSFESDAFVSRLREVIGGKKVLHFAKECGIGESTLRNILDGAAPRADILIAIADTAGVTIDWLSTGRLPKTRRELTQSMSMGSMRSPSATMVMDYSKACDPVPANGMINAQVLQLCLEACQLVHGDVFTKTLTNSQLLYSTDLYNQLVALANAKSPATNLDDFCRLDAKALADQLRFFLQMGWATKFPEV